MTATKTPPTIEDAIEAKAADDPTFAVAYGLLRLADAADRIAEAHEGIAESVAAMAKQIRVRQL